MPPITLTSSIILIIFLSYSRELVQFKQKWIEVRYIEACEHARRNGLRAELLGMMPQIHNAECSSPRGAAASSEIDNLPGQKPASTPEPPASAAVCTKRKPYVSMLCIFFLSFVADSVLKQILMQSIGLPEAYSCSRMAKQKTLENRIYFHLRFYVRVCTVGDSIQL